MHSGIWAAIAGPATLIASFGASPLAWAEGITPASDGTGTQVTPAGPDYTITGGSLSADQQNLFHSFTEFTLLQGESATFLADPAVVNILSRITGGTPSFINGLLQVRGSEANVFLINPSGILLGPQAALNLQGSFTATTADQVTFATGWLDTVGTPDYTALVGLPVGFSFTAPLPGSVVNAGDLQVAEGQSVMLLGGQVLNTGTITAPGGEILISAVEGGSRVRIETSASPLALEVETLAPDTATTPLPFTPLALPALLTGSPPAMATGVTVNPDGTIQLTSGALATPGDASVILAGSLDVAAETQGGTVSLLGTTVDLQGATVTATGQSGGGTVRIGGEYQGQGTLPRAQTVQLDATSRINADAINQGDGGRVILWADDRTTVAGQITARGGITGGDGGLVETSGLAAVEVIGGRVEASAPQGQSGLWLLDPTDIVLDENLATTIKTTLAGGTSFALSTLGPGEGNGDIQVAADVEATAANNASLTLTAARYIEAVDTQTINLSGGQLILNVNQAGLAEPTNATVGNAVAVIGTVTGGTTLTLGAGTYQEPASLVLTDTLRLRGAGQDSTFLTGSNLLGDSILQVANNSDVILQGLSITGAVGAEGAGIRNAGTLTIRDSRISDNTAIGIGARGGGIFNQGQLTLTNSVVSGNTATLSGGGLFNDDTGTVSIANSQIQGNVAQLGGGLAQAQGDVSITTSLFADNRAQGADGNNGSDFGAGGGGGGGGLGGAIFVAGGSLTITNSTFSGNQAIGGEGGRGFPNNGVFEGVGGNGGGPEGGLGGAPGAPGRAGGFASGGGGGGSASVGGAGGAGGFGGGGGGGGRTAGFSGDPGGPGGFGGGAGISGNSSGSGGAGGGAGIGGAIFARNSTLTLQNSTLSGNRAQGGQGGVDGFNAAGIEDAENGQGIGGGLFTGDGTTASLLSNTVSGNTADIGGGIANFAGSLAIRSSLVSGNTAGSGANLVNSGTVNNGGNNLWGASGTTGLVGLNPVASDVVPVVPLTSILAPTLADNGGPTPTLALVAGSPAIDAGSGPGPDQRGVAIINGIRDIGAYEFGASSGSSSGSSSPPVPPCLEDCGAEEASDIPTDESADASPEVTAGPVAEYEDFLGVEAVAFEDFDALQRAVAVTGVPPALVYARFVPATDERSLTPLTQVKSDAGPWSAEALVLAAEGEMSVAPAAIAAADDDVLELVLVLPDGRPRRVTTGATRAEVLQAVKQLHIEITDRTRRRTTGYLEPAQRLYAWLVAPLHSVLEQQQIGHLSFILDKGLRSLPLAALHDGDQFIIETYSVGLMPSLSLTDTRISSIQGASVLAMGASEFADQPPLPGVPVELSIITDLWSGARYLNQAFTPEQVLQARSQTPYQIVHLATHGQFVNGTLSDSYIQFWNRRLSLNELPTLQLGQPTVELLVLSACRTVLGGEQAELGFAGLAVKSGVKSAIAALWQVSDLETVGLMAELYTHLQQAPYKAEALRQAQLAMLQGEVTVREGQLIWSGGSLPLPPELANLSLGDTQHPYYWASFALVGSPW